MKTICAKGKFYLFLLFAPLFFIQGCDDNFVSSIPDFHVYLEIDLRLPPYNISLRNNVNSYELFEKPRMGKELIDRIGYGGIIVYADFEGHYRAFDLACPHEAKQSVKVVPDGLGRLVCEECGSIYDISYGIGHPVKGPSKEGLKRYTTSLQQDFLYITAK